MERRIFYGIVLVCLCINPLYAQVAVEKQANNQFIYKFNVNELATPAEAKQVIAGFLSNPNILDCSYIPGVRYIKLHSEGELSISTINEVLGQYNCAPLKDFDPYRKQMPVQTDREKQNDSGAD